MTFIEVHNNEGVKFTIHTPHILTIRPHLADPKFTNIKTEITLAGGSALGARALAMETYDEVRRLIGLDWLHCGEMYQGDICDRRIDSEGRCPIHGRVGA